MTTTQDVANAIVALSGEGTGFISGEVIGVDGGEFVHGSDPDDDRGPAERRGGRR